MSVMGVAHMTRASSVKPWQELYDESSREGSWIRAHRWRYSEAVAERTIDDVRRKLGPEAHHAVLEVGCGSGAVLRALLAPGQRGVGVDLSQPLLSRAAQLGVDVGPLTLIGAEGAYLPFRDGLFDRVLCYSVFPCYPSLEYASASFRELVRVCRPGGLILLGDVCGIMERLRTAIRTRPLSVETVRAALDLPMLKPVKLAIGPFRRISRKLKGGGHQESGLRRRHYTHRFFQRLGEEVGCSIQILPQDIEGRDTSKNRFDVLIREPQKRRAAQQ
jgi:SAM-dependent methyltransferase